MSNDNQHGELWEQRFNAYLKQQRYSPKTIRPYMAASRRFIKYLVQHQSALEAVQPEVLAEHLRAGIEGFRQRYGHPPEDVRLYRHSLLRGIPLLLRLAQGDWPPKTFPSSPGEIFHHELYTGYAQWLVEIRGLAAATVARHSARAKQFLSWLEQRRVGDQIMNLSISDIDAYQEARAPQLQRPTRAGLACYLRSFLRYLHAQGWIARDLAPAVAGPTLYAFESIPSALKQNEVAQVLKVTRQDHSPIGLRDYAILLLLSAYGLRAGEVVTLCLEDVNWRHQHLRVHHWKTRTESLLPLLPSVGNAILDYLRRGRPATDARQIFIRAKAPYRPFLTGSSLHGPILSRLVKAGIHVQGRHGPHSFRHACAVNLLRAAVPLKAIGDILGHCKAFSTLTYLKLATDDLRAVGLEAPKEVKP
jgi:integrase/recombinase XerD